VKSAESLIEQFGIMVSVMATRKDTKNDYVVKVNGLKVDVLYRSPDIEFIRSFLAHVIKVASFEDLSINIKGPPKYDLSSSVLFCTTTLGGVGTNVVWSDTSVDTSAGSASVTL